MQDLFVLNLVQHEGFKSVLKEVSLRIKVNTVEKCESFDEAYIIFTDTKNLAFVNQEKIPHIVGVISSPSEIKTFYNKNIFCTIPEEIASPNLEALLNQQVSLRSIELLKHTFKNSHTYSFDHFIYFADNILMHSSMGIAFLTTKLSLLLLNPKFSDFFQNIFNQKPTLGKRINAQLNTKNNSLWNEIITQKSSFKGLSLEFSGKWNDSNKHYGMDINPIFKASHLIGYSIIIEDISQFTNANADLKRYYKYLLEQNTRLEKAYKEVELNNEKLKIAYEKVNALSNRDYLTQAPNRKYFLEKIEYEQLRFKRTKIPFLLAYGDIDDFKKVNDTYGHETGDYILISLTNLFKKTIRNIDFFCRWGGEEFLIFLAESDLEIGKIIVERILNNIRNFDFTYNGIKIKITMTFGLAVYNEDQHINQIIDLADQKLYWGKNNNKNQVVDILPDKQL